MRKSRFAAEQISTALRQVESGAPITALCRVSESRWISLAAIG